MVMHKIIQIAKNLPNNILASFRILKDSRVSKRQKIMYIGLALTYMIWPWDFIFDIPFVGQIDDLAVFIMLYSWFMKFIPEDVRIENGWKK